MFTIRSPRPPFQKTGRRSLSALAAAAAIVMMAGPLSSLAGTVLEYTGLPFDGRGPDAFMSAVITLPDVVQANTIYDSDDFVTAFITDSGPYYSGTFAIWNSYIQTDAAGNVAFWDIRNDSTNTTNRGSYNCPSGTPYCDPGFPTGNFLVGDGDSSSQSYVAGTWLCADQCLAGSNTVPGASIAIAPEPSTYGLMLTAAGLFWILPKRLMRRDAGPSASDQL